MAGSMGQLQMFPKRIVLVVEDVSEEAKMDQDFMSAASEPDLRERVSGLVQQFGGGGGTHM